MGIIKIKKANEEETMHVATETVTEGAKTTAPVKAEANTWDDPAILGEDESMASENARHYVLNNGTAKTVISAGAVNYYDEDEKKWKEINNSLIEKDGGYESECGNVKLRLSSAENGKEASLSKKGKTVKWEYLGKQTAEAMRINAQEAAPATVLKRESKRIGSRAVYENIENNVDLEYVFCSNDLKENIIVKEKADEYRYVFALGTEGLKLRLTEDNAALELYGDDGKTEFTIPSPFMYDAAGEESNEVYYELDSTADGKYAFAVVADADWINAEGRAFPVTIDPQITTNNANLITGQVQKRTITTSGASNWANVSENYIKVFRDYSQEYRTILTVKKSLIKLLNNQIVSINLILDKTKYFSGYLNVNGGRQFCNAHDNYLSVNVTNEFKNNSDDFTLFVEPTIYKSDLIDAEFYLLSNSPKLEIEYVTNENNRPTKKTFALAGAATGEIDLSTGDFVANICDVPAENSVMGLPISHVYKKSATDKFVGKNFHLNLHEKLEKYTGSALDITYKYTDASGDVHGFKDYYYYINTSGKKVYVDKSNVTAEADGTLKYINYVIYGEYRSATGLKAITKIDGIKYAEYVEQRADEMKQADEKADAYETALEEFVIVNKTNGDTVNKLESYLKTPALFDSFIKVCDKEENIILTESEALTYKSLKDKKQEDDKKNANDNTKLSQKEKTELTAQITLYEDKKDNYYKQIIKYYKEYSAALASQKQLKQQMPVNFLTDGKIFKGYNENGDLVSVFDMYDNNATIEYEYNKNSYRIARIYDNNQKIITFSYTPDGKLNGITDCRGRKTLFGYNGNNLENVTYDTGEKITLDYNGENLFSVTSDKKKIKTEIIYTENMPNNIYTISLAENITNDGYNETFELISTVYIEYEKPNLAMERVTIYEEKKRERYYFDAANNLSEYRLEENGVVTRAEHYEYVPYWTGAIANTNPHDKVTVADKSVLYKNNLDKFSFTAGETVTTTYDQFENALTKTTSAVNVTADGGNKQTVEVEYVYDEDQKVTDEKTTVTYTAPAKVIVSHKKYNYNAYGDVIRTESYVEGEENTNGKTIEETVYDKKGNVIKTFTYNSKDTSSKIYKETEFAENGQVVSETDETGENKVKYNYAENTDAVKEEVLPNGSKFAYGRDYDDTVTAITQSTDDGEENSTQKAFTLGELTEVKSGNNTVKYTYDHKRRITNVELNGAKDYVTYEYKTAFENNISCEEVKTTNAKNETLTVRSDKRGNKLSEKFNDGTELNYEYDTTDRLIKATEKKDGNILREFVRTYDSLDNPLTYSEKIGGAAKVSESYVYDKFGAVSSKSVTEGGKTTAYNYGYKADSTHALEGITVNGTTVKPQTDVLGRNNGKEVYFGENKVAEENIIYRKVSDRATNMPCTVRYGNNKNGQYVISDSVKYTYDNMGNISAIYENGELANRYEYDALNRLIREDNKALDKTVMFVYDNNGNILKQRVYGFTLKNCTEIEEQESVDKEYIYNGDKLLSYNGEACVYDAIGNPTAYRGKVLTWEKGRRLTKYGDNTFTYDAQGRRQTKNGIAYTYGADGNIISQNNGLDFYYDHTGVSAVRYNNAMYFYRKDAQGNILAILDSAGNVVVRYIYDAWGNHAVVDNNGDAVTNGIGAQNPFRYRGYYYDVETGLYYLKTRYYDPETGRFITIDGISYLDPESINGLNLYAYCANNPVMFVDPNGTSWLSNAWNKVKNAFRNVGKAIKRGLNSAYVSVKTAFNSVGEVLNTGFNIITNRIKAGINWLNNFVATAVRDYFPKKSIIGFQLNVGMEEELWAGSWGLVDWRTGYGFDKNYGDRRPITLSLNVPSKWWKFWDYSIGVDANINGWGVGIEIGTRISFTAHLGDYSFSVAGNILGQIALMGKRHFNDGYEYFAVNINLLYIILAGFGLYYGIPVIPGVA